MEPLAPTSTLQTCISRECACHYELHRWMEGVDSVCVRGVNLQQGPLRLGRARPKELRRPVGVGRLIVWESTAARARQLHGLNVELACIIQSSWAPPELLDPAVGFQHDRVPLFNSQMSRKPGGLPGPRRGILSTQSCYNASAMWARWWQHGKNSETCCAPSDMN